MAGAAHAQVYKCHEGGRTVYSDAPCSGESQLIDSHRAAPAAVRAPAPVRSVSEPSVANSAPVAQQACPSEQDIANMQTSASSRFIDRYELQLQQEDIRRAQACRPVMTDAERSAMLQDLKAKARASRPRTLTCVGIGGGMATCN